MTVDSIRISCDVCIVSLCGQDSGNWESQILTIGRSATLCWNLVPPFQQIWQEYVLEVAKMFWLWNCYTLVLTSQDCLFLGCNAKHPPMMKSWCWLSRLFLIGMKNSCQDFNTRKFGFHVVPPHMRGMLGSPWGRGSASLSCWCQSEFLTF